MGSTASPSDRGRDSAHALGLLVALLALSACEPTHLLDYGAFTFTDRHGVRVIQDLHVITPEAFEAEIDRVTVLWESALPDAGDVLDDLYVWLAPRPFRDPHSPGLCPTGCEGAYSPRLRLAIVGVGLDDPLEGTALGHELGHVILWRLRGDASEEGLRAFTLTHGLPY